MVQISVEQYRMRVAGWMITVTGTGEDVDQPQHCGHRFLGSFLGKQVGPFLAELLALITEHGGCPINTPVAIEMDKKLIVVALAGFTIYPINPRSGARYRERHGQAGGPQRRCVVGRVCRPEASYQVEDMQRILALALKNLAPR